MDSRPKEIATRSELEKEGIGCSVSRWYGAEGTDRVCEKIREAYRQLEQLGCTSFVG